MARYFNLTGPCNDIKHFKIDPLRRVDYPLMRKLIDRGSHFSLCAGRSCGRTTFLLALQKALNKEGNYRCLYCGLEGAQSADSSLESVINFILGRLAQQASLVLKDTWPTQNYIDLIKLSGPESALLVFFERWRAQEKMARKPFVLLLDDIDTMRGEALKCLLSQLRMGQVEGPDFFPHSVILAGVRDVRGLGFKSESGYYIEARGASDIRDRSFLLENFSPNDVRELCMQYMTESGCNFYDDAYDRIFNLTDGMPWLVNAILNELAEKPVLLSPGTTAITANFIDGVKFRFTSRQNLYLDQIKKCLSEQEIRETLFPILSGGYWLQEPGQQALDTLTNLGLIKRSAKRGCWLISNPICCDAILQALTRGLRDELIHMLEAKRYVTADGNLDYDNIINKFRNLFRENYLVWQRRYNLKGLLPQVLLYAVFQCVMAGRGHIELDCAPRTGRVDFNVLWGEEISAGKPFIIEFCQNDSTIPQSMAIKNSMIKAVNYAKALYIKEMCLVIMDMKEDKTWFERFYNEKHELDGVYVHVYGL